MARIRKCRQAYPKSVMSPWFSHRLEGFRRLRWFAYRSPLSITPHQDHCPGFSTMLTTLALSAAACDGLGSVPDYLTRRAYLHLLHNLVAQHYRAFGANTGCSAPQAPHRYSRLAVFAACAFSLGIAGQVLTFRIGAWLGFAPSTRRLPSGPFQASPGLIPKEGSPPGFDSI